jgi:hypothetical protein
MRTGTDTPMPVFVISIVNFCPAVREVLDKEPSDRVPKAL